MESGDYIRLQTGRPPLSKSLPTMYFCAKVSILIVIIVLVMSVSVCPTTGKPPLSGESGQYGSEGGSLRPDAVSSHHCQLR